jgi:hypothetical protein
MHIKLLILFNTYSSRIFSRIILYAKFGYQFIAVRGGAGIRTVISVRDDSFEYFFERHIPA